MNVNKLIGKININFWDKVSREIANRVVSKYQKLTYISDTHCHIR